MNLLEIIRCKLIEKKGEFSMAKENMKIRMESELKVLRCHGIPFEVKSDEPNRITCLLYTSRCV